MNTRHPTGDDVRTEHLKQVNPAAHWVYIFSVLGLGTLLMLGFIALLGATSA